MSQGIPETKRLLSAYRLWGLAAVLFFVMFLLSALTALSIPRLNFAVLSLTLCFGFLWIGTTSVSRHCLVQLKQYIGKEIGLLEFVSTQFVFALFPLIYRQLKMEVTLYEGSSK